MKQMKQFNKDKIATILLVLLNLVYGVLLVYLHYNQTLYVEGGLFEADTPYHIKMAVEDNWYYSITAFVYVFFYKFPCGNILVGIFLSMCHIVTILGTYLLLKEIWVHYNLQIKTGITLFGATALNLVMAFYVKNVNARHYIG